MIRIYFSFGLARRNICIVSVLLDAAKNIESGLNANEYIVATLKEIKISKYSKMNFPIHRRTPRRNSKSRVPSTAL